ncbi:winged helix-turn-helix transcriptional regulator [Dactylosporangium aurantiacum]|uniref:Winged helix-turn-helix transcriptional regulator n=1 Tax=Dactylosporangium aurantiacum TaxID=35754 RepID=A0A9Q9IBB8_9ACTN|nr:winged helix-turn-helix transcriptional regulator [Dactylosporangium aurantiacum]MDG6103520.1 winged helix-turn-helix transcriptional regulator [Dactylosporangium aurantiacum]UWZ51981.1 winged helix-turn-helix transcriptional regulator [Dactylosporangium aurantiacum]
MDRAALADADCGISQALGVMGDGWTFLIVRDIAGGTTRFDALQRALGVSRRALTERLARLVEDGVLRRRQYSAHPPRYDYLLTAKGEGLLPVLVALQDWGTRHVMGTGALTATADGASAEARRVHALTGRRLPDVTLTGHDGTPVDLCTRVGWTVLYCFPGAYAPGTHGYPPGWSDIPGAPGCTLESITYAARHPAFLAHNAEVYGVSTQRPDQLAAFVAHARLPFPLLSDQDLTLTTGLLLPTFRAGGVDRLKRLTLLADPTGTIREVQFPVTDPAASVDDVLATLTRLTRPPA